MANVSFVAAAASLRLGDGAFDLVACRVAAHHFHDVRGLVGEMAGVLAPGGRLLIIDFWEMRMDFDDRTGRMHTPPESVAALKQPMDAAPADVRARLGILDGAYDLNIPLSCCVRSGVMGKER